MMKIGFIGCGNMASAMIGGMLKKGLYSKEEIIVSNLTEAGSRRSREKLGVVTSLLCLEVPAISLSCTFLLLHYLYNRQFANKQNKGLQHRIFSGATTP